MSESDVKRWTKNARELVGWTWPEVVEQFEKEMAAMRATHSSSRSGEPMRPWEPWTGKERPLGNP